MYWVIQDNIFQEPWFDEMIEFLQRMDIPYEIVKAVPFSGEMIPVPSPTQEKTIFLGSYSFTNRAIKDGFVPGSWTNDNYDYRVWSTKWKCLNNGTVYKFGEIPEQTNLFFIRPCADDKAFTGQVFGWEEFSGWRDKVLDLAKDYSFRDITQLDKNSPVVVAVPRKIQEEYRFVIVDGKVITGSQYGKGLYKQVTEDQTELIAFVQECADCWTPARVFVVDVALCGGEYSVIEMGNMNSAGLYRCDSQKIVMAIEEMVY